MKKSGGGRGLSWKRSYLEETKLGNELVRVFIPCWSAVLVCRLHILAVLEEWYI